RLVPRRARRVGRPRVCDRVHLLPRDDRTRASRARHRAARGRAAQMTEVSAVVVTYNALPWIEQSLESVRGVETVVGDHGSADGPVDVVRSRFPDVTVVEEENRGLAYGWNTGVERTTERYVLLLNADAWLDPGALDALVAAADAHPEAAVVGPRLR